MNMKKLSMAVLALGLIVPGTIHIAQAEGRKAESAQQQKADEDRALEKYNKAVEKHGKESKEARRAWRHYQHELKEHGHAA